VVLDVGGVGFVDEQWFKFGGIAKEAFYKTLFSSENKRFNCQC